MERISKADERHLLCQYLTQKGDNMFPFLYEALRWRHDSWQELAPEQVWKEAILLSDKMLEVNVPKFEIPRIMENLQRTVDGEHNADFLITLAAIYRLTPLTVDNEKLKRVTAFLLSYVMDHPLYEIMKKKISYSEHDEDLKEYRINILEYQIAQCSNNENGETSHTLIDELVDSALQFSPDEIVSTILLITDVNMKHNHAFDTHIIKLLENLKVKNHNLYNEMKKIIMGDEVNGDKINNKTIIPSVGTYNAEVTNQNNNYPAIPFGQQGQKQLEE